MEGTLQEGWDLPWVVGMGEREVGGEGEKKFLVTGCEWQLGGMVGIGRIILLLWVWAER